MCRIDDSDGFCTMLDEFHRKALKEHKCSECGRIIPKGEVYLYERTLFEGHFSRYKTCRQCQVARSFLSKKCHGFMFQEVAADLQDHIHVLEWGFYAGRLCVGMKRKWKKFKSDELMEARVHA